MTIVSRLMIPVVGALAGAVLLVPLAGSSNAQEQVAVADITPKSMCFMEVEDLRDKANSIKWPAPLAMEKLETAEEACRSEDFGQASQLLGFAEQQIMDRRFKSPGDASL